MSDQHPDDRPDDEPRRPRSSADLAPAGRRTSAEGTVPAPRTRIVTAEGEASPEPAAGTSVFQDVPEPVAFPGAASSLPTVDAPVDPAALKREDRQWVRYRRSWGPITRLLLVAFVVLVMFVIAWRWVNNWVDEQMAPNGPPGDDVEFVISEGDTTNEVAAALGEQGIISNSAMFRQWLRCPAALRWLLDCPSGVEYEFRAGEYILQENLTYEEAVARLAEGPLPVEVITVTVPEGLTLEQMRARLLSELPLFDGGQLDAALISESLVWEHYPEEYASFGIINLEGLLFPDTYQLDEATEADELALLQRMQAQFTAVVDELDIEAKAAELGYTPYEIVTIASMIEEEARQDEDRPKIARVIYNRLAAGELLGIDATTRYAYGLEPGEPLTTEQLEDPSSPYNTRAVPGIPPTPISAPGRASLEAALNPEEGDWMYYALTDPDGYHTFSVTAEEHAAAVQVCIELELGCG